jgi:SAM-dependent methyltransferase
MRVLNGFYPNPSVTGTFDVITMLDVLEHIEDDKGVLAELFKQTAPGGVVHLTVPAYQWLWSSHDTLNHHYRRYTRSQIVSLFSETGFEVMKASYFNALLFPMVALVRIAERFGLYKPKDNFGTSGSLLNRPLAFFFALERFLLRSGNLPFGVSIVCVARRPGKLQSF